MNSSPRPRPFLSPASTRAFSLVEVVLAIGVISFAFVAILGLIPAGMGQFRKAMDTTICAQIAQRVIGDAQQTDFDTLVDKLDWPSTSLNLGYSFRASAIATPEYRYFDERGVEIIPASAGGRANPQSLTAAQKLALVYQVNTRVMPQSPIPRGDTGAAAAAEMAMITVQVINNPGLVTLTFSTTPASTNLVDPTKTRGVSILTYSAQIARNQ